MGKQLVRVTMNLTHQDVDNTDYILNTLPSVRSKAHAVSVALSLSKFIIETMSKSPGAELQFAYPQREEVQRIIMPELTGVPAL